ncbi:hypothetical protein Gotur_034580 [Gossypium turneri]
MVSSPMVASMCAIHAILASKTHTHNKSIAICHTHVAAIDMKLKSFETEMESEKQQINGVGYFQMPLHYPRYTMKDYQNMPEWKLDRLLAEYGLSATGDLDYKRKFAMGAFFWPHDFHANQKPKAYYGY